LGERSKLQDQELNGQYQTNKNE